MPREIDLRDEADRWRYVCPAGHRSWEPTNHHFWCKLCAAEAQQSPEEAPDPTFDELLEESTGEPVHREEVVLVDRSGWR